MDFFNLFSDHSTQRTASDTQAMNSCPNCWGEQEYQGRFWESTQNAHIDLNNILQKKGWIQAYIARYFEGIQRNTADDLPEIQSP